MTRAELIALGNKIISPNFTEKETSALMDIFNENVPYPNGSVLFFYPENFNSDKDDISKYNPSVEEVVDKCLAHKSTILGIETIVNDGEKT